jgi:1A family penicillin-binding protein
VNTDTHHTPRGRLHELGHELRVAKHDHPWLLWGVLSAFFIAGVLPVVGGLWIFVALAMELPDRDGVRRIGDMEQATTLFDSRDQGVFTIFREQRVEVPLSQISPNVVQALLAIEDQRFRDHRGFDTYRIVSAAFANIRSRRAAQGASTITQQLARQAFLKPDKTLRRKVQEVILAGRIEQMYTKEQILELYLNRVYFGDGRYGIETASRGYFGKHASELTVAEAATLAGLVKSPSSLAPTTNLEKATARRNIVLQAMHDAGVIDRAALQQARETPIQLSTAVESTEDESHGQYFKEQVRRELVERFGWQQVYQGGLRVYTTLDMPLQQAAEAIVSESLQALTDRRLKAMPRKKLQKPRTKADQEKVQPQAIDDGPPLQAAMVVLDPQTGHVRAMIGGRDFNESRFNRAVQARRQPGSAFKPFVYAAALETGYTPASVIDHLDDPVITRQGAWTPDDEHSSGSAMTLRSGLRTSSNRAAVRLLQKIGIPRAVQYAKTMGVGDVPSVPSLALGSGEVTLEAMTAAYAAFANRGRVPKPILIRRVEDHDGRLLFEEQPSATRAVSETTAFLMSNMLADVVNAGTAAGARRLGFTLPAAGKTGTTNDYKDAWFVGFTPRLVAGVWVGFDQAKTILPRGFASDVAVPIWAKFMKIATSGDEPAWFKAPPGIVAAKVCRLSGLLASDDCTSVETIGNDGQASRRSMVYTEHFSAGTAPTAFCTMHEVEEGIVGEIVDGFSPPPARVGELPRPMPVGFVTTPPPPIERPVQEPSPRVVVPRPPPVPTAVGTTGTTAIGRTERPAPPRSEEPPRAPSIPTTIGTGNTPPLP